MVEATFHTPPLNFDLTDHTRPLLRHHGSISVARSGQDAANSGEMSRWPPPTKASRRDAGERGMKLAIRRPLVDVRAGTTKLFLATLVW